MFHLLPRVGAVSIVCLHHAPCISRENHSPRYCSEYTHMHPTTRPPRLGTIQYIRVCACPGLSVALWL